MTLLYGIFFQNGFKEDHHFGMPGTFVFSVVLLSTVFKLFSVFLTFLRFFHKIFQKLIGAFFLGVANKYPDPWCNKTKSIKSFYHYKLGSPAKFACTIDLGFIHACSYSYHTCIVYGTASSTRMKKNRVPICSYGCYLLLLLDTTTHWTGGS